MFHELPIVQAFVAKFPNIRHTPYRKPPTADYFEQLSPLFPYIDQPIRNIPNFDWFLAGLRIAGRDNSRSILSGTRGNGSISWVGEAPYALPKRAYHRIKYLLRPFKKEAFYYRFHRPEFMRSKTVKQIFRKQWFRINYQHQILSSSSVAARQTSLRPFYLWHGIENFDPTADRRIVEFCYSVPQWVYRKGDEILDQRLLVREGLEGLVPEVIRQNPFKGEQAADWYLCYNRHFPKWKAFLNQFYQDNPGHLLFQMHDHAQLMALFEPISGPGDPRSFSVSGNLLRYLSSAKFMDFLASCRL